MEAVPGSSGCYNKNTIDWGGGSICPSVWRVCLSCLEQQTFVPCSLEAETSEGRVLVWLSFGFPGGSVVKNSPASAGDVGLTPESGR